MPYTCPHCGATSEHPRDAEERYCARCRLFEDEARDGAAGLAARRLAVRGKLQAQVSALLILAAEAEAIPVEVMQLVARAAGLLQGASDVMSRLIAPGPPP